MTALWNSVGSCPSGQGAVFGGGGLDTTEDRSELAPTPDSHNVRL
jgi:hypothetical protein